MRIRQVMAAILLAGALIIGDRTTAGEPPPKPEKRKFAPQALGMDLPVITSADECDKYVGRLVAVRGTLQNTKPARIVGVQVNAPVEWRHDEPEAYAVGILTKFTVTEAEYQKLQDDARKRGNLIGIAHPGPGVYYLLFADLNSNLAEARRLPK